LKQAFVEFTQRLPFYGVAAVCVDDPCVREIMPFVSKTIVTYGLSEQAQIRAVNVQACQGQMKFTVLREDEAPLDITLNLPGDHNVRNSLAAIAVATEIGVADEAIVSALEKFNGVGRRFQHYGEVAAKEGGHFLVVDDYGHHPVEMDKRLVLAFQPHRYTRTRDCFEDFVKVLGTPDLVILSEVYSAGEAPIVAADGRSLARAVRVAGRTEPVFVEDMNEMESTILNIARDGDLVITMGAGSIGGLPGRLVANSQGAKP
jgi:UDP-N-acetylmuramate--alanine ligase